MHTAGTANAAVSKKNAPGRKVNVAIYTEAYRGAYTSGIKDETTPNNEFTFPEIDIKFFIIFVNFS